MKKLSMDELGRISVDEFKAINKNKVVVVIDNIRSVYNVGSIFRTADAFLIEAIIICGYSPTPEHRQMAKTALGATDSVDWMHHASAKETVLSLKEKGYYVFAIEQATESIKLQNFKANNYPKIAVVLGNEVEGVQQEVIDVCDGCIEIPQLGTKHSLNVATAAGVIFWKLIEHTLDSK